MSAPLLATPLTALLGCSHPVISAGMGGPARSDLAAAVSAAGGFGLLGMVREPPALIEREIAAVRARTNAPFGVNLIPFATPPKMLEDELAVCFNARVPAMCFFWEVYPDLVARSKAAGALVLYQVGSVEDAVLAAKTGADVVIVAEHAGFANYAPETTAALAEWAALHELAEAPQHLEYGDPPTRIAAAAAELQAAIVVLGSRHLGLVARAFLSSTASSLAGLAAAPVAVVPNA